jgi:lipopolysaccharide/colanic/teichoic acid biosynthesis glycosyltransferase
MFRTVAVRERRRAERFEGIFALLVIRPTASASTRVAQAAIDAVCAAKRETDLLGSLPGTSSLGLLCIDTRSPADVRAIERRIRREIQRRAGERADTLFLFRPYVEGVTHAMDGERPGAFDGPELDALLQPDQRQGGGLQIALKRCLDVVGSAVLLLLLLPVILLIAAAVKLTSPGPIFYRQTRVGRNVVEFPMLKFRTMRVGSDHRIHRQYVTQFINGRAGRGAGSIPFKITGDPRVTAVGHWLRRSSLDELPQLWNVLRGEMSLVGPRPPIPYEVAEYRPWHRRRLIVAKPGITGLWQVTGRSRTTFDEMVRLDLRYARRISVWTDLKLLLATPAVVISGKGAC